MRRYNKYFILILILIFAFAFTGCKNIRLDTFKDSDNTNDKIENKADLTKNDDSDEDDTKDLDNIDDEDNLDDDTPTPTIVQPIENIELLVYVVNSSTELDPVTALVPAGSDITPELIVNTVVDSMADQSLVIGVESVSTKDDAVIISFYSDKPPLSNVGSGLENAILDALAQSLTENLDDYNKIIYRVEGGPYISGHIELGIDEVYFEDAR
ncbi:MAG: hypothetical protein GX129_00480 [Clostridiales bacterium]|jgi:hypothetical protein|nr:hypothetical protein [Clostridiales bacterium]